MRAIAERATKPAWAAAVGVGLLAVALGVSLALALLPEWRVGRLPDERPFRARFQEIVRGAGFQGVSGRPSLDLTTPSLADVYLALGKRAPAWLARTRSGVHVEISGRVRALNDASRQVLDVELSLDGHPLQIDWRNLDAPLYGRAEQGSGERRADVLEPLLLQRGESFGATKEGNFIGPQSWRIREISGSEPPQEIVTFIGSPGTVSVVRRTAGAGSTQPLPPAIPKFFVGIFLLLPFVLAAPVIFLVLLLRGRIDLVNGAVLGLAALISASPHWLMSFQQLPLWMATSAALFGPPGMALWIFFIWSAGESLLRALRPDFTTSLDILRVGRLGPRGGRSLLLGFALGSGLAGARLALYALALLLPSLSPAAASVRLPIFGGSGGPVMEGIWLAAGVTLATAMAVRFLPVRWALPAAALLAGYSLSPLKLLPLPAELIVNAAYAGALVWICRRHGLTTLLSAAVVSFLLPAAVYAGLHMDWMAGSFAVTAVLSAGFLVLGLVGVSRPESAEAEQAPPPFMRRLAEERRLRHEVDLLARMQLGLLPQEMPRVEGYQVAARSVLASEAGGDLYDFLRDDAGGLWIAAGDVAGHGYSCAVAQAMVKAGLLSLVEPEESPAGVLRQLDRVLRGVSMDHSFTSLALIRLDPATGGGVFANAGHPYPLIAEFGRVTEVELPGLPLGRGLAQPYADREFRLPQGAALVLCSDGLFEALDRNGNAYGFDRVREVLRAMGHRPAVEIVDALLNDCRRHLGAEAAPDDVTVVVVKRG